MAGRAQGPLLGDGPPAVAAGLAAAAASVAVTTLVLFGVKEIAPVTSLGVLYLLAVLLVSAVWGAVLGVVTALASALAFNFFHLPPTGRFTIADSENWVALGVFLVAAVVASTLAQRARDRTAEAEQRRREADLSAEMARLLLRGEQFSEALAAAAQRLAAALQLPSASIELSPVEADERRLVFPLREGPRQIGTLVLPTGLPEATLRRGAGDPGARGAARRGPGARRAARRRRRDARPAA